MELDNSVAAAHAHACRPLLLRLDCGAEEVQRTIAQMRLMIATCRHASQTGRETIRLSRILLQSLEIEARDCSVRDAMDPARLRGRQKIFSAPP